MMLLKVADRIHEVVGDEQKAKAVIDIIRQAENDEKSRRLQKQIAGIEAARKRGVQFGRPMMEFPPNFCEIYHKQKHGLLTVAEASQGLNISRQQFYRLRRRYEEEAEI